MAGPATESGPYENETGKTAAPGIDRILFAACVVLIVGACVPMALFPEQASVVVTGLYDWIAGEIGILYQWMTLAATIVLAVLAFGKYGRRRLGGDDAVPEFNNLSWMAMLFCAGIGAGLLYWSAIEWAFYLDTPPFGLEGGSP